MSYRSKTILALRDIKNTVLRRVEKSRETRFKMQQKIIPKNHENIFWYETAKTQQN